MANTTLNGEMLSIFPVRSSRKPRVTTLTTSLQQHVGGPGQGNKQRKEITHMLGKKE